MLRWPGQRLMTGNMEKDVLSLSAWNEWPGVTHSEALKHGPFGRGQIVLGYISNSSHAGDSHLKDL